MKITASPNGNLILEEIYAGVYLQTREGNMISICMRDDSFEINIIPRHSSHTDVNNWWRVDMKEGVIESAFKDKPWRQAWPNDRDAVNYLFLFMGGMDDSDLTLRHRNVIQYWLDDDDIRTVSVKDLREALQSLLAHAENASSWDGEEQIKFEHASRVVRDIIRGHEEIPHCSPPA